MCVSAEIKNKCRSTTIHEGLQVKSLLPRIERPVHLWFGDRGAAAGWFKVMGVKAFPNLSGDVAVRRLLWLPDSMILLGPSTWPSKFPSAAGSKQSPIDIKTNVAKALVGAKPLMLKYSPEKARRLINLGYGWKVEVNGEGSELSGGPLEGTYKLEQFHCHWGCNNERGSEHTIDGRSYAAELHMVHWNCTKYSSFAEAATHPDGLAVVGVLIMVGKAHEELGKVTSLLPDICYKGDFINSPAQIDPGKLLPRSKGYWTYQGSLTIPPCSENVTWIIFKEPIEISEQQLNLFRNLRCHTKGQNPCKSDGLLKNNFRPPLPLGNRELRECSYS